MWRAFNTVSSDGSMFLLCAVHCAQILRMHALFVPRPAFDRSDGSEFFLPSVWPTLRRGGGMRAKKNGAPIMGLSILALYSKFHFSLEAIIVVLLSWVASPGGVGPPLLPSPLPCSRSLSGLTLWGRGVQQQIHRPNNRQFFLLLLVQTQVSQLSLLTRRSSR